MLQGAWPIGQLSENEMRGYRSIPDDLSRPFAAGPHWHSRIEAITGEHNDQSQSRKTAPSSPPTSSWMADVKIDGGKIVEIGANLSGRRDEIDATGCYVMPGGIDPAHASRNAVHGHLFHG